MACEGNRSRQIGDLAAGRLPTKETDGVLRHLESCPECSAEFDLVADLVAAADRGGAAYLDSRPNRFIRRLLPALAAAAAVFLAVVLFRPWEAGPGGDASSLRGLASTEPLAYSGLTLRSTVPSAPPSAFETAMERYAAGDFAAAAQRLDLVTAASPGDPLANLYLGISRLQTGEPGAAIGPLERAASRGEDLLRERALWYLGNARLALGEAERALEILQRLGDLRGDYEPNAREKFAAIRAVLGR